MYLYLFNVSPDKMAVDASNLTENQIGFNPGYGDYGRWQQDPIGKAPNQLMTRSARGVNLSVNTFINPRFIFNAAGDSCVPIAVVADQTNLMKLANYNAPDFKAWLSDYGKLENWNAHYGTPDYPTTQAARQLWMAPKGWMLDENNNYYYQFINNELPLPYGYAYMVMGAVPYEPNAVQMELSTPLTFRTIEIGSDYKYKELFTVTATLTNNASYPVYMEAHFETTSPVFQCTPRNNMNDTGYRFEIVGGSSGATTSDTTLWLAPGEQKIITRTYQPVYHEYGTDVYYENFALDGNASLLAKVWVRNITHLMGGAGVPASEKQFYKSTIAAYPGVHDEVVRAAMQQSLLSTAHSQPGDDIILLELMANAPINVLPVEKVENVTLSATNVTFDLTNARTEPGTIHTATVRLVPEADFATPAGGSREVPTASGIMFASDTTVATGSTITVPLNAEKLSAMQSGNYRAVVNMTRITPNNLDTIPIANYGISPTATTFANPIAPATPTVTAANYIGDGSVQLAVTHPASYDGYEVRLTDANNDTIKVQWVDTLYNVTRDLKPYEILDYPKDTAIILSKGMGLQYGTNYHAILTPYKNLVINYPNSADTAFTTRIYGAPSTAYPFSIQASAPAVITAVSGAGKFIHNGIANSGNYYAPAGNVPVGNVLTAGMTGLSIKAALVSTPFFTSMDVANSDLTIASDNSAVTVDAAGNLTIGAFTAPDTVNITVTHNVLNGKSAVLTLALLDEMPINVSVDNVQDDNVTLALAPHLAAFITSIGVNVYEWDSSTETYLSTGNTVNILAGLDAAQTVTIPGLTPGTGYKFELNPTPANVYRTTPVYIRTNARHSGFTVTYSDAGKTSGTAPLDPNDYQPGDVASLLDVPDVSGRLQNEEGEVLGFSTQSNGSGTRLLYTDAAPAITVNGNVTLYPIWPPPRTAWKT